MVSNAPGYARNRRNRRGNKAEFTAETTRVEKRHIVKSGQKAKRQGYFGKQENFINAFWEKHNGKTVIIDGLAYKIKYSEYNAIYPYKHVAVSVDLIPVNKRSEHYLKLKHKMGDDWSTDALSIPETTFAKIYKQLEK